MGYVLFVTSSNWSGDLSDRKHRTSENQKSNINFDRLCFHCDGFLLSLHFFPSTHAPLNTGADSFWEISSFIFATCHVSRGQIAAVSHTQNPTQLPELWAHPPQRCCSPYHSPPSMASSVLSVKVNYTFTPQSSLPYSVNSTSSWQTESILSINRAQHDCKLQQCLVLFGYSGEMITLCLKTLS